MYRIMKYDKEYIKLIIIIKFVIAHFIYQKIREIFRIHKILVHHNKKRFNKTQDSSV